MSQCLVYFVCLYQRFLECYFFSINSVGLVLVWILCISFLSLGLFERRSDTCSEWVSPKCQTLLYWCPCSLVFCQNTTARQQRWWCSPVWEVTLFQHSFSSNFTNLLWITCTWWVLWHTKRLQVIFVQICSVQCNYFFFFLLYIIEIKSLMSNYVTH